jgi:hypothetical protein
LFTNVPTDETIEIILRKVFQPGVRQFHGMTREILKKLVICTKESHFQFNGRFYEQIDGVAMGSPLGPLFANAFMSDFEEKHIGKLREMSLNIWLRYRDDVYAAVKSKGVEEEILLYLNSQHPNIRFTMELENGDSMPFLDVRVIRRVNKYETTVYHKKTLTGVYLNWTSLTSRKYKVGLIKCLLDRIWKICSTENDRAAEIEQLRRILKQNEFPQTVVESEISKYMARKTSENVSEPSAEQVKP